MSTGERRTCLQALCCYNMASHCVKEVLIEYLHMKLSFVSVGKHESLRRRNSF